MKRNLTLLVSVLMLLSIGITNIWAQDEDTGLLRFVHVIPNSSAIDIYTDGQLTVSGLAYGQASNYINAPAGTHEIVVRESGQTSTLWQQQIDVSSEVPQTLLASTNAPLQFNIYSDDFTPLELGTTRFKAIHAIDGGPDVDILAGGDEVVSGLSFGEFIGTFDIPVGLYELTALVTGEPSNIVLPATPFSLISNSTQMLILYGTPESPQTLIISQPTNSIGDSGFVRLAHWSSGKYRH